MRCSSMTESRLSLDIEANIDTSPSQENSRPSDANAAQTVRKSREQLLEEWREKKRSEKLKDKTRQSLLTPQKPLTNQFKTPIRHERPSISAPITVPRTPMPSFFTPASTMERGVVVDSSSSVDTPSLSAKLSRIELLRQWQLERELKQLKERIQSTKFSLPARHTPLKLRGAQRELITGEREVAKRIAQSLELAEAGRTDDARILLEVFFSRA